MSGAQEPLSVSDAVGLAKRTVNALPVLVVRGEISGFRGPNARSGHCYFELKDEDASMSAIVWRTSYQRLGFELKDGMEVLATGGFDVYEPTGRLSFIARKLELSGEGALRQRVARLARRLSAEGLMADERKRPIPVFCEHVALVTSLSGSVKADVLRTLARRNPLVEVDVVGCAVQGEEAPASIVRALKVAASTRPDAILLVRGGGSYEELMAFNDEGVARAIASCPVPVVTGIGHEPDITIADMVADRRQSTPTSAAESVAPPFSQIVEALDGRARRLTTEILQRLSAMETQVEALGDRLPRSLVAMVERRRERLDALASSRAFTQWDLATRERALVLDRQDERLADALQRSVARLGERVGAQGHRLDVAGRSLLGNRSYELDRYLERLDAALPRLLERRQELALTQARRLDVAGRSLLGHRLLELDRVRDRLDATLRRSLEHRRESAQVQGRRLDLAGRTLLGGPSQQVERLASALRALDPWSVLGRGYAIVRTPGGHVVTRAADVQVGEELDVILSEGALTTQVQSIEDDGRPSGREKP